MPLITLYEWGKRLPVPRSAETLRRWVRANKIDPHPAFDGHQYLVEEDAVKINNPAQRSREPSETTLTERIKNGRAKEKP